LPYLSALDVSTMDSHKRYALLYFYFIAGPPRYSVGGSIVLLSGVCHRRLLSSVGVCNTPRRACRRLHRTSQAMTSCHLQS